MSHPKNRLERFLTGKNKGLRRGIGYWNGFLDERKKGNQEEAQRLLEGNARIRRNTTKLCSCPLCGNPRKIFNEQSRQELKYGSGPIYPD